MRAKRLAKLLAKLQGDKTQVWLAKEMNVTASRLGTYRRGEIEDISVDFLSHVADYMGISLPELMEILEGGEKRRKTAVKDKGDIYRVVKLEDLTASFDHLDSQDVVKAINYLSGKLIVV